MNSALKYATIAPRIEGWFRSYTGLCQPDGRCGGRSSPRKKPTQPNGHAGAANIKPSLTSKSENLDRSSG
jgi:hypothetical protein